MWSFVGSKANKQWIWLAIDADSREIVGVFVGARSRQGAKGLWQSLPSVYRQCAVCYTDFWSAYEQVLSSKRPNRFPQLRPGDVILIDNARSHHSQAIDEIVAEAGCELWYLPPYSPDLNKIEHWWFVLKNWMRQRWNEFDSFRSLCRCRF